MTETTATKLTPEQQAAILYWPYIAGFGIVKIDSKLIKPRYDLESSEQRNQDVNSIDYEARKNAGWYDSGVAIRCGWTIGHKYYGVAVDLDGWNAVKEWFGDGRGGGDETDEETWDRVIEYAKVNRVEWHKDRTRLHLILYLHEPIRNVKIPLSEGEIKIQGEGLLLRVSPSIHYDGNPFTAIDSEQIAVLNGIQRLKLLGKIGSISEDYLSENESDSISDWLHNSNTIFGERQGRHNWTLWIVNSYFWKYSGEWLDLTDEQRFEHAWNWHNQHCDPSRSREEFDRICTDVTKKYRQERDKKHEEIRQNHRNNVNMPGCISYEINPGRFIIGTPDNKIAEVKEIHELDDDLGIIRTKIQQVKTFTACKPITIVKHNNPLSFLEIPQKYTIEFRGSEPSGFFTAKHKTLVEIISRLKDGNALTDWGFEYALTAQIKGFEKAGLLQTDDSIDYIGFFPYEYKRIISNNITIPDEYPDVTDALDYIHELESLWYAGRDDLLAHTLLWFMIAPCSFIFKVINAPLLDWVHLSGNPNTGKTTSGLIGLGLDAPNNDNEDFNLNMKHIDTIARFGDTIKDTTFPEIINEVDLTQRDDIVNNIITAVDAVKFRKTLDRHKNVEYVPGLTPLFLTGNPKASNRPEYVKRVKTRYSTASEVHLPDSQSAVEYKRWLASNVKRGHTLGKFRNKFVMEHQDLILDTNLIPFEKSINIWTAAYESVGRKLPNFFNKKLEEHQMQESIEDKRSDISIALQSWVIDKCKGVRDGDTTDSKLLLDTYQNNSERLVKLINKNLISCVIRDSDGKIVFLRGIVTDLERHGVKQLDLPNLADAIPNAKYGKFYRGKKVVKCSIIDLEGFFNGGED